MLPKILIVAALVAGISFGWWLKTSPQATILKNKTGDLTSTASLTRHYPNFVKCAAISAPELRQLTNLIDELKSLGHNTICIGKNVDRFIPALMDKRTSDQIKSQTLSAISTFKKAGFAISLDIDTGGPMAEKEYTKLPLEQFVQIVEEDTLEWAALAEEYQVEYFTPAGEMKSKFHNLLAHYLEPERKRRKIEKANEWYSQILPKVRQVFKGKVVARFGGYDTGYGVEGYDAVAYTSGHSFITDLDLFRQEIRKIYANSLKQAAGKAWWVTTYLAYGDAADNPNDPSEYTTKRTQLQDLQDDYYRIVIEEIDALPKEQRPQGFEGGHIPFPIAISHTDEAKEVVKQFFLR